MNSNEISTSHRRRVLAGAIAFLTVAGVVAFASTGDNAEVVETAVPLNSATIERGDLVVNESLDGVVENVDQLQVVHRVDEASVGTGTTGNTATGAPASGVAIAAVGTANLAAIEPVSANFILEATPSACDPTTPTTGPAPAEAPSTTASTAPTDNSTPVETTIAAETPTSTSTSLPTTSTTSADVASTPPEEKPVTETTAAPVDPTPTTTCDETTATTAAPDARSPTTQPAETGSADRQSTASRSGSTSSSSTGSAAGTTTSSSPVFERVTSVAAAGVALEPGDIIYTVDGQPVVAMLGDIPAWRDLSTASDDGIDVLQFETTLERLGYDNDGEMVIDETYDSDTAAAVKAWQVGLGLDDSGIVTLGDIVFLPASATVSSVTAATGDDVTDGSVILTIDAQRTQIRADVPTDLQTLVAAGTTVTIGGDETTIERLVSREVDGTVTVQAIITPVTPIDTAAGSTITLRLSETVSSGNLVVPASSITSRLDGTYAVRLIDGETLGDWVPIIPIAVVDGNVAIDSSQLDEGATIATP